MAKVRSLYQKVMEIQKVQNVFGATKLGKEKMSSEVKKSSNIAKNEGATNEDWGKCFMAENIALSAMTSINFNDDWIIDSGCGHHLTTMLVSFPLENYGGNDAIIMADNTIHLVEKEGSVTFTMKIISSL